MRVTVCGHAGLLIETASERILVDPILRTTPLDNGFVHALPRKLDLSRLPEPTLVVVTHEHFDHFDPESLRLLPRSVRVVAPPDAALLAALSELGFADVTPLAPWQTLTRGDATLLATPSGADVDELGLLVTDGAGARLWHMSDAEASLDDAARIAREHGPVHAVSCKYQPITCCVGVFRSLGPYFDKTLVAEWLEAACSVKPRFAFPYAWGLRLEGDDAWVNRYVSPFSVDDVVRMLRVRLRSDAASDAVQPGDVLEVTPEAVTLERQASPWLAHDPEAGGPVAWEPIDASTLRGLPDATSREELKELLWQVLRERLSPWLLENLRPGGALANFPAFGVVWQLVVHLGDGERAHYAIDFGAKRLRIVREQLPHASYFAHVSGKGLLAVLRGEATAARFHTCGDARFYEKILVATPDGFGVPPVAGFALFECLPDPLTHFLRYAYSP